MEGRRWEYQSIASLHLKGKMRAMFWSISICLVAAAAHASSLGVVVSEKPHASSLGGVVSEKPHASSLGVLVSEKPHVLKLPDFFRLVVQYPLSVCEKKKCGQTTTRANLPTAFSIHGLWEGMNDKNKAAPITSQDKFDVNKLVGLKGELDKYWFDAFKFDNPAEYPKFWKHEWEEHGRKSGYHLRDYFETTVKGAYEKFRLGFKDLVTRNSKYLPGREFKLDEFLNSFATTQLAVVPWARCHGHSNGTYLITELVFRIDPATGDFVSQAKADDTDSSCSSGPNSPNVPNVLGLLPSTAPII